MMGLTNGRGNWTAKPLHHSRVHAPEFQMCCRVKLLNFQIFILWQAEVILFTYREFLSRNLNSSETFLWLKLV